MAEESITTDERIRKLASIQEITDLQNHPDPETQTLQVAFILGWQVVVSKSENLKKGQHVVFCEIDSMLPGNAEWLPIAVKKRVDGQKKKDFFRVKTIRLRGELSQGLIVPLSKLCGWGGNIDGTKYGLGDDLTSLLKIEKYEAPISTNNKFSRASKISRMKSFPSHLLSKTDEPRIQSYPGMLKTIQRKPYYSSVKLDGMSATYVIDPETKDFLVCSRNYVRECPEKLSDTCPYFYVATKYNLEEKLRENPGIAIQGEICGPNIQKNPLGLKDYQFYVFNVVDVESHTKKDFLEMCIICKQIELETAPVEESAESFEYESIGHLLERAKGKYEPSGKTREGLVFRTFDQSISFKVINNDFLL